MGTYSTDDFESGTRAALAGGTTMVVDFVLPGPQQGLHDALKMWHNKSGRANCDYSYHMAVTWWGEQVFDEMATIIADEGITTFKHFMAYKGALMVNDDEMYASFQRLGDLGGIALVHAENGDVVAELQREAAARGQYRARGACLFAAQPGRRRGDQPGDHDRRYGRGAAVRRAYRPARRRTRRSAGRGSRASGSGASR